MPKARSERSRQSYSGYNVQVSQQRLSCSRASRSTDDCGTTSDVLQARTEQNRQSHSEYGTQSPRQRLSCASACSSTEDPTTRGDAPDSLKTESVRLPLNQDVQKQFPGNAPQVHPGLGPLACTPVILHVYDLGRMPITSAIVSRMNKLFRIVGAGAFHAAVEVYGEEWSFGYCPEGCTGVFSCAPGQCDEHRYLEPIAMGHTWFTRPEVAELIADLECKWPGSEYDLLQRNCCHFSDEFCRRLGVGTIPNWVSNLSTVGANVSQRVQPALDMANSVKDSALDKARTIDETLKISRHAARIKEGIHKSAELEAKDIPEDYKAKAVDVLGKMREFEGTAQEKANHLFTKLIEVETTLEIKARDFLSYLQNLEGAAEESAFDFLAMQLTAEELEEDMDVIASGARRLSTTVTHPQAASQQSDICSRRDSSGENSAAAFFADAAEKLDAPSRQGFVRASVIKEDCYMYWPQASEDRTQGAGLEQDASSDAEASEAAESNYLFNKVSKLDDQISSMAADVAIDAKAVADQVDERLGLRRLSCDVVDSVSDGAVDLLAQVEKMDNDMQISNHVTGMALRAAIVAEDTRVSLSERISTVVDSASDAATSLSLEFIWGRGVDKTSQDLTLGADDRVAGGSSPTSASGEIVD